LSQVIEVPEDLNHRSYEELIGDLNRLLGHVTSESPERVLFNAKHMRWISPYGMVGLLAAGRVAADRTGLRPSIEAPEKSDVRSYMDRMDFWQAADDVFEVEAAPPRARGSSDALLEITAIRSHHDVHAVVERVRERSRAILESRLNYPTSSVIPFSVMLSEVCQNILEHAETDGWVCAQTYDYKKRLGREVLMLAVMDVGIGFHGSLGAEHARRYGEGWSSATALEAALLYGESRFRDPGRGQGLQAIRRQVSKWGGELAIRSGNAMIALVPDWDDLPGMQHGLADFPGAQILIVIPARVPGDEV